MIDLYVSTDKFILRKGAKTYAAMLFADLKLLLMGPGPDAMGGLSDSERAELTSLTSDFVPGQVVKGVDKTDVVLGPAREFTHEVTLRACGNPDHGQFADIGPKKTVRVVGIEEAQKAVSDYQSHYDMGGGNCAKEHGVVWELPKGGKGKRKKVGAVSYNGRYQTLAEKASSLAALKTKHAAA